MAGRRRAILAVRQDQPRRGNIQDSRISSDTSNSTGNA